ncbi:hypothetical protein BLNAU_9435 [Blattamonas nauphoetae]|uniref:Protein kinase domain-containing protein n=1 Tax=Blattamonas nauphoetae TaxID=2049346 RepID=A0ABQ9XVR1_9EUKA|nr:hypothetical protein BLNAU_9435 [Blattamonas nauphoetae]
MTLLSSNFVLHSQNMTILALDQTSVISNEAPTTMPLFTLHNSSFSLFSGRLVSKRGEICSADEQSVFSLKSTLCDISTESPVFSVAGILQLASIELRVPNNQFRSSLIASSPSPRECMISEMSISDSCVTTRNPLFGSHFEVLSVIHCSFQNISQPSDGESVEFRKNEGQKSVIVGSSISKSENGLYGLLMRDTNDRHQLTSLNCTFVDNIRTFTPVFANAAPIENEAFTDRQISTDNDITFKKCTFTSCSAPTGQYGGAIYHNKKGSLAVDGCTFTNCQAKRGSAVDAIYSGTAAISGLFQITGSHFDRCGSDTSVSAIYALGPNDFTVVGTFLVENNNFTHMQSRTRVGFCVDDIGGGSIHNCRFVNLTVTENMQAGCKVEGANGDVSVSDCYFCEMFNYTSGVAAFQYVYGQTKVERLRFVECHANRANSYPALIIFGRTSTDRTNVPEWYAETPDDNPVVSDCWFEATDKETIADIRMDVFPEMKQTSVTEIWSTSNPFSISWEGTAIDTIRQTPDIVIDDVEGLDEEFCWMREKGCRTMSETINDRTSGKFEGTFLLASDSHSDSGVVVGQRKLVIKPQSETKATISDEGSSLVLFSISTGSLDLSTVDFSPHIESSLFVLSGDGELKVTDSVIDGSSLGEAELSKPLFEVKGGRTTLTSLILLSMTSSVGLISATSGSDFSLVISKSTFSALTRRVGSGVVVEGRMGSTSSVSISESKFTECHTLDEDYVEHNDPANPGAEPNIVSTRGGSLAFVGPTVNAGTVKISSSNFSDCSCANSSGASINVCHIARLSITSCRFENQFASGHRTQGGAVSGWDISDATVRVSFFKTCHLSNDSKFAHGGAITFQGSQSQTDLCQFEDCSASYAAHAIHIANSDFTNEVTNCVFDRCVGVGQGVIHGSSITTTRFLNCSFIGCCDSKADTTIVVGLDGSPPHTLEISKCYVIPDFATNKKGVVRLTGSYETNPAQVIITECGFLSASPHLLPSTIQKDGIGFPTLRVSKGEVGGEKEGEDSVMCGHPDRKCLTLRHAATLCRATEGTEDMISVIVGEGEHSEETIAVGGMRIGVRGEDGKKSETKLRSQDGTRLMTLGDGLLSLDSLHHRPPIDLVIIINHLEQWNALDHITGTATLDSCDLPALLFSNKEAFITVASEGTLLLKSLSCDQNDASSDSLVVSSGSVALVDCSLSNIALASSLLRESGDLSLSGCTFTCLLASTHSEDSSHVVDVTIGEGKSLRIGKSTSNSKTSFVSCSSKEDGGGLKVCVSGSGVVELAEVHFSKCSSSGNGGAVLIEVASLFAGTISFSAVEFGTGDDKNTATLGTDLFVTTPDLSTLMTTQGFLTLRPDLPEDGTFGKEEKNGLMGKDGDKAVESLLFIWYSHRSGEKHVEGATGEDHANCGLLQLPCLSLSTAHQSLNETNQTISIDSSLTLADSVTARSTGSVLTSTLSTPPTLTIASAFSFVVSAGPIELSSLSFVPKEEARSTPLFSISNCGSLSVRSCSFSSFQSTSSPSILFGSVGSEQSVSLDSITFTSCWSSGQVSSGVISLSLSDDSSLSIKGSTTITTCSSPTAESDFLFLSRPAFTKSFVSTALSLAWNKDDTTTRSFVGKEGSHSPNVPLYLFLAELGSDGHLSNSSCDMSVCGFEVYPCASLSKMITRLSSAVSPTIQLDTDFTQSTSQSFSSALTIEGNDRKLIIADSSTELISSGFFAVISSVALNAVVIEISSLKHVNLISILTGKLKMEGCTILLNEGSIRGSVVKVEDGGSLVVNGSVFTDIVSSDSKGGVIVGVVSESSEFRIDNTTFSDCKCEGIAHCIWMELRNSSTNKFSYSMTNIEIERTKKETKTEWNEEVEEWKKVTDVFVMGSKLDVLIETSDWEGSFTKETNAESLWGEDGVSGVDCSLLVYLIEILEAVEVDGNGETFTKCGHFLLFCSSMELGVNRLIGADLEKIRVMESIWMDIVVSLEGDITICGSTNESTLLFTPTGRFVNELHNGIASSLSIDSLIISFPTTAPSNPLFVSSCGTLSFTSCSITSSIPITQSVISIEGGILRVTGMSAGDLEMTDCALIDSKGNVELSSSTFERIVGNMKKGSVLWGELGESVEVSVKHCSFEECSGDGETRWIELKGRNTHTLVGSNWEGSFNKTSVWSGVMVEAESWSHDSSFNPYSLLYEFHPRSAGKILVSTTEKSEDHPLCGSLERPCRTISDGVTLTNERNVEIVGSVSLNSKIADEWRCSVDLWIQTAWKTGDALTLDVSSSTLESSEGIVVCENGEVIVENVVVSSSRSINPSLLVVWGGRVNVSGLTLSSLSFSSTALRIQTSESMTLKGIEMKNTSCSTLLSLIDGQDAVIDSCHFTGKEPSSNDDASPSICTWDTGLLVIANSSASVLLSLFTQLNQGAIHITNSSLSIHSSTFSENTVPNTSSSARKNVRCASGTLTVGSLGGGDGLLPGSSAWMSIGEECLFSSPVVDANAPFFIPAFSITSSKVKTDTKCTSFALTLVGETLIPCGLFLEVFEKEKGVEGNATWFPLSEESTTLFSETKIELTLASSSIKLNRALELHARLLFGMNQRTSSIELKKSDVDIRKSQATQTMKWLLPVIGGLIALFVFLLVLLLLLRRRKKQKAAEEKSRQELNEIQEDDVEKVEDFSQGTMNNVQPSLISVPHSSVLAMSSTEQTVQPPLLEKVETNGNKDWKEGLEVMADVWTGEAKMEQRMVCVRESLFERLHGKVKRPIDEMRTKRELTRLLLNIAKRNMNVQQLKHITPHDIIVSDSGEVSLKVNTQTDQIPALPSAQPHMIDTKLENLDALATVETDGGIDAGQTTMNHSAPSTGLTAQEQARWAAPEVSEKKENVDGMKASVFSLGLVLWEIETGVVPFAEHDAQNAQRQIVAGTRPNLLSIPHTPTRELIEQCLQSDPSERPTLEVVYSLLQQQDARSQGPKPAVE